MAFHLGNSTLFTKAKTIFNEPIPLTQVVGLMVLDDLFKVVFIMIVGKIYIGEH